MKLAAWPILGLVLAAFGAVVAVGASAGGPPERAELTAVKGELRSLDKATSRGGGFSAVRFTLGGDARQFQYSSKAGEAAAVWNALSQAGRSEVRVLVDPKTSDVYEIGLGAKTIRPYAEVAAAWRDDDTVGRWLGYAFMIAGAAFLVAHFLRRR